jgi:hypothetical protein
MAPRKPKAHELEYRTMGESGKRTISAIHEGRIVGHLGSSMTPLGRKLDLAWVDPSLQRRGIGATMVNLERHRSGHMPIGDEALSAKGSAFQKGLGVPANTKGEVVALPASAFPPSISHSIQDTQGHMLHAKQFDPKLVRQVATYKPGRRKSQPQPTQPMLPGTENF